MMRRRSDLPPPGPPPWAALVPPDSFYARLAAYRDVLVRDEDYAPLCKASPRGRPSIPPSLVVLTMLPQYHDDCSGLEAEQRLRFDPRWRHALGLALEDGGFDATVLCRFRRRAGGEPPRPRLLARPARRADPRRPRPGRLAGPTGAPRRAAVPGDPSDGPRALGGGGPPPIPAAARRRAPGAGPRVAVGVVPPHAARPRHRRGSHAGRVRRGGAGGRPGAGGPGRTAPWPTSASRTPRTDQPAAPPRLLATLCLSKRIHSLPPRSSRRASSSGQPGAVSTRCRRLHATP
jgi:hypothetical protein